MLWDIFCRVIDNHGDLGVCWRLSADLAQRGHQVRLWVDDASALEWMAPGALQGIWPLVQVLAWERGSDVDVLRNLPCAEVWIEAFGCELPEPFIAHFANALAAGHDKHQDSPTRHPVWINLEYLSAEPYVERSHALPSPLMHGPAKGWTKYFYYPGFTQKTGGLLREPDVNDAPLPEAVRTSFLQQHGIEDSHTFLMSLFCYEPALLGQLISHLAAADRATHLLVTQGRAHNAVRAVLGEDTRRGALLVTYLPLLSQPDFDLLLRSCDLNFVRGEDSVIRALWAGKPFVWHIYPQDDGAHAPKLQAFMQQMQWSPAVQKLYLAWNGLLDDAQAAGALQVLQAGEIAQWQIQVTAVRARQLEMSDLLTRLLQFVQKNR
jgi:uncharacterized repeat protein (TIGR03837 family)